MNSQVYSLMSRVFFIGAVILVFVAVFDFLAHSFGYRLSFLSTGLTAGRLLELAAVLVIFVMAVLLRQIREELRKGRA